jgi:hypothetical protein
MVDTVTAEETLLFASFSLLSWPFVLVTSLSVGLLSFPMI